MLTGLSPAAVTIWIRGSTRSRWAAATRTRRTGIPLGPTVSSKARAEMSALSDRKRDDVKRLKPHCCVDLRIRYERHLDFARDCAKSGNPQVHVSCREATLLDAALHCNSHCGNIEDHASITARGGRAT